MKQFVSVDDVPNLDALIEIAKACKSNPMSQKGAGKCLGLVFFNPSLRTRLSTQKAAMNLGMQVMVMNVGADGWALEMEDGAVMTGDKAEHIKEAAMVLGTYCDIIGVRSFPKLNSWKEDQSEPVISAMMKYAGVPVVSLESECLHPLQSLADMMTIQNQKLTRPKITLTWAPHPKALPHAVAHSFLQWVKKTDAVVTVTHPKGYELDPHFTDGVNVVYDQDEALKGADLVYAKNWSSLSDYGKVLCQSEEWTINDQKMDLTNNGKLMHCLPIRRNVIATDHVIEARSLIKEQAENRLWAAQAVLSEILNDLP